MKDIINKSALHFEATVDRPYFLYRRKGDARGGESGSTFLSMVSPDEFGEFYTKPLDFLGCFSIDSQDVWHEIPYEKKPS